MSIDVLFELQHEVRRLFIAGSGMAAGDTRLSKLLATLQKLGETAPIFKRVAQSVEKAIEPQAANASNSLLELGTLLHSILYTQGRTDGSGELTSLAGNEMTSRAQIPYRKLKPVMDALVLKGQGRLEVVRQAYEEGIFQDIRILVPAVSALEDSYGELAEYMFQIVIPSYGGEALPILRSQLQLRGGRADSRRLQLIHKLLGQSGMELYIEAVREGSAEVRATALELLGHYPEQEDLILEQSNEKRKEIRLAAWRALAQLGTERAVARLHLALTSKDREQAIEAIQLCEASSLTHLCLQTTEEWLAEVLNGNTTDNDIQKLHIAVQCLDGKREPEVLQFLKKLLSTDAFMIKVTEMIQETAVQMLVDMELPDADQFAVSLQHVYKSRFITYSFIAALRLYSPQEIYDRYAADIRDSKKSAAKQLLRQMSQLIDSVEYLMESEEDDEHQAEYVWDARWIPLFVEIDQEDLVCSLVQEPNAKVIDYLVTKSKVTPSFTKPRTVSLLLALFRLGYKDAPNMLMDILESGSTRQFYYLNRSQRLLLTLLPKAYAERLAKFAEKLTYESVKKQVLEIVEAIQLKEEEQMEQAKGDGWLEWIKKKMF